MSRMLVALVASGALGAVGAWAVLANAYPHEGPWLPISRNHGIHVGDVAIVGVWALISAALLHWAGAGRRTVRREH